jgi:hypothetical protein
MDAPTPTNPLAFLTLGAAAAALSRLGLPQGLALSAALATALFVAIRREPVRQHLGAAVTGALVVVLSARLAHTGVAGLLMTLAALGVVGGAAIGWRSPAPARPGFRFLREDFFEFCGFVGVLAAFPAVLAFGINGAADWVGRLAFELAFLGAWVLLPMSASAWGVGRLVRARRATSPSDIALAPTGDVGSPVVSER